MRSAAALPLLPAERLAPLAEDYARIRRAERRRVLAGGGVALLLALLSLRVAEVDLALLWERGGNFFGYFGRILTLESGPHAGGPVLRDPAEWFWGWDRWLLQLGDTVLMAYVGTLLGCAGGFALGLLSAANIVPSASLRWGVKRALEFCRTVPEVVFALVFVIAFGLGPLAGVLAIALHSLGAQGKLFSEVVENIDPKPVDGAAAAGASWTRMVRFAVVPQALPGFVSYALLRFEVNVRGASVLGFVGAGGVGQDLVEAVRKFYYNDVAALLVLIILTVTLIDAGTGWLRRRLLGAAP
jgi:phosphonate transport system permease protein